MILNWRIGSGCKSAWSVNRLNSILLATSALPTEKRFTLKTSGCIHVTALDVELLVQLVGVGVEASGGGVVNILTVEGPVVVFNIVAHGGGLDIALIGPLAFGSTVGACSARVVWLRCILSRFGGRWSVSHGSGRWSVS